MPRKASLFLLAAGFSIFYAWVVFIATHAELPSSGNPIVFYSNQTRQDIKLTFLQALNKANQSIFLSVYGITDPQILAILEKKSHEIPISVEYDLSASSPLNKLLPSSVVTRPVNGPGLMHRKIVVIDQRQVFLGTANLTPSSLHHHDNLVLGLYHPELAEFLASPSTPSYQLELEGQRGELYLFPDPKKAGLNRLIALIDSAHTKINIAIFTLTHPEIGDALVRAKTRGVEISIAIDAYTARGASKKLIQRLEKEEVKLYFSQGKELLHHKWAVVDDEALVIGSANWTKAAFNKNHDFLFFLSPLQEKQIRFLNQLWRVIEVESKRD